MEPRFGHDFSKVRVHTDAEAAESAQAVNALAYTVGRDVVFGAGQYAPQTSEGRRLLAHELTHVVQQQQIPGKSELQGKLEIGRPDDLYEQQAEAQASRVMEGRAGNIAPVTGASGIATLERTAGSSSEPSPLPPGLQNLPGTSASATSCPKFISMTARVPDPNVAPCKRELCRLGLGCCETPRGVCANGKGAGSIVTAKVEAGKGCTGELAFMQNAITIDRRRTLNNGTQECLGTASPLVDGGVPFKGCSLSVTAPGTYTIIIDDCASIPLKDSMTAASVADSFKTFLLWKPTDDTLYHSIANVTWGWRGAVQAKGDTGCETRWTLTAKSHSNGDGKASNEEPARGPKIQDKDWGPCKL
jgi:Domain of unknown function (DUF4157)